MATQTRAQRENDGNEGRAASAYTGNVTLHWDSLTSTAKWTLPPPSTTYAQIKRSSFVKHRHSFNKANKQEAWEKIKQRFLLKLKTFPISALILTDYFNSLHLKWTKSEWFSNKTDHCACKSDSSHFTSAKSLQHCLFDLKQLILNLDAHWIGELRQTLNGFGLIAVQKIHLLAQRAKK